MANIRKKVLKNGRISFSIQSKATNPKTKQILYKFATYQKPVDLTHAQAFREAQKIGLALDEELRKEIQEELSSFTGSTPFDSFAFKWLERLRQSSSPTYICRLEYQLPIIVNFFGKIKLRDITPSLIQEFIDKLQKHIISNPRAKLKKSLKDLLKIKKVKVTHLKEYCDVSHTTYLAMEQRKLISLTKAQNLCNFLNIKLEEYFEIFDKQKHYAKDTIKKFRTILSSILSTAKRLRLIDFNFAEKDYLMPIRGDKKTIEILNDVEAKKLKEALDNHPDIRKKTSLSILLLMGIRRGELVGLEWKDIDFENKTMSIQRASYDVHKFGMITKEPKTYSSKRKISIPETLLKILKEYKDWWDTRKASLGDLWEGQDRLFINDYGELIRPKTYTSWLKKILVEQGLKVVSLHSLRHTNITLQLASGVDLKTVSQRAGHSRPSTTTDVYTHWLQTKDTQASAVIDKIFQSLDDEAI